MNGGNGRVEPGQAIKGSLSARAWNRAQQAADIVLGAGGGLSAGDLEYPWPAIVVPIHLPFNQPQEDKTAGYAIEITGWSPSSKHQFGINFIEGKIAEPRDLIDNENDSTILPTAFGITVEPMKEGQSVVRCAIAGLCVAKIRYLTSEHRYASLPVRRTSSASMSELSGVLETSDTGYAVVISTNYIDKALVLL